MKTRPDDPAARRRIEALLDRAEIDGPPAELRGRTLARARQRLGSSGPRSWWPDLLLASLLLTAVASLAARPEAEVPPPVGLASPSAARALAESPDLQGWMLERARRQMFPSRIPTPTSQRPTSGDLP